MAGARGLLINITGGEDMTLFEVDQAANRIREEVAEDANIIFGSAVDENLSGRVRVSVVATGIDIASQVEAQRPRLVAVGGGAALQPAVSQAAPATPSFGNPSLTPSQPAQSSPVQLLNPRPVETTYAPQPTEQPQVAAATPPLQPSRSYVPPAPAPRPASANHRSTIFSEPSHAAAAAPPVPPPATPSRSLFGMMTRGMRGRAAAPEANGYNERTEPQRAEPSFQHSQQPPSQMQQPSDEALEIPAFLRRQTS
jgi:cell division protein FtsZ